MLRLSLIALGLLTSFASAQPNFPEPKTYPPDEATLKEIAAKSAELKAAIGAIRLPHEDVAVYLKAAEWIVRHGEWYSDKSAKQTLDVLNAGLKRVKDDGEGKSPWREVRGRPIICGYRSLIDWSVQPYSIQFPANYDPKKLCRIDVVLHGRDATLTEVKFIAGKEAAKADPKLDHIVVEVYGRGNNAYRWAGENDVFTATRCAMLQTGLDVPLKEALEHARKKRPEVVLRGFSMGGAGTWHIGLHHPDSFAVMGPGAGFTTTRGYIKSLPTKLPEYIEKCLHIYDAVDYAENVFMIPVVAYSGGKDAQKAAADNIETALKGFKEPHTFNHLVAPGLEHKQPADWLATLDVEYRTILAAGKRGDRARFVTYTTQYPGNAKGVSIGGLDEHYSKSVLDVVQNKDGATITTKNIRRLRFDQVYPRLEAEWLIATAIIDGQKVDIAGRLKQVPDDIEHIRDRQAVNLKKVEGQWTFTTAKDAEEAIEKTPGKQGPIDDAFRSRFRVALPTDDSWHTGIGDHVAVVQKQFADLWDKHLRGKLPSGKPDDASNAILFGDPGSNPAIAEVLPKLPIKWTKDELVVNGVKYDSKTHYPALIYPNPKFPERYVVINSGHTFKDADFRGTNALLYPRLGDWAVLKPKPIKDDPGAVEVVAAGIFDEFWQFKKAKK